MRVAWRAWRTAAGTARAGAGGTGAAAAFAALALLAAAGLAAAALLAAAAAARLRAWPPQPPARARAFVPGGFLEGARPANRSYCRFHYGLPSSPRVPPRPPSSPELGAAGPFRVLYNVLGAPPDVSKEDTPGSVTLCTHATADMVFAVAEQVVRWEGPLSLAVFAPRSDAALALALLRRLCTCLPQMARVSAHLVFPAKHPPDLSAGALAAAEAAVAAAGGGRGACGPPARAAFDTFRRRAALAYPVNAGRNVARAAARTRHVLVVDVELLPSAGLAAALRPLLAAAEAGAAENEVEEEEEVVVMSQEHTSTATRALTLPPPPRVFVLPVFEVEQSAGRVPSTKAELLELYAREEAFVFHRWLCPHCQRFPGLLQWLRRPATAAAAARAPPARARLRRPAPTRASATPASPAPSAASTAAAPAPQHPHADPVQPLISAWREPPYHRWEPVFVGSGADPLYAEALTWEGRQDKMTQAAEMCLRGYRFVVLDGAFLVHAPGVKRPPSPPRRRSELRAEAKARAAHERANAHAYARIARRLAQRYPQRAERCRV